MSTITLSSYNCTVFFKFAIVISTVFCFSSCQTTQYHAPIALSQDEIKSLVTLDEHGRSSKASAGQIKDCATMRSIGESACAYIVCKDDKTEPTGLTCDYFFPKTSKTEVLANSPINLSTKDQGLQKQIKDFVTDYESGKKTGLEKFCNQDKVVCYYKAKPFPLSKSPSAAKLATLVHKESTTMNSENLEISVFKD